MWRLSQRAAACRRPSVSNIILAIPRPRPTYGSVRAVAATPHHLPTIHSHPFSTSSSVESSESSSKFTVGDISVPVHTYDTPKDAALVPTGYDRDYGSAVAQPTLAHLRWMMQKDLLGQDMMLLGPVGPERRELVMRYAELSGRQVEYVPITRDTTESDLKQRREIQGGSAEYSNQAPVRAAMHGRLLILDGLEKAERNVLPTLNNLLENREMQLDDGTFLTSPSRFQSLIDKGVTEEELRSKHLVPVHPDFRVIALGVPVPPYKGKPLDPPLRSRFQGRYIGPPSASERWTDAMVAYHDAASLEVVPVSSYGGGVSGARVTDEEQQKIVQRLASLSDGLYGYEVVSFKGAGVQGIHGPKIPHFPSTQLPSLARLVRLFPEENPANLLARAYPYCGPVGSTGFPVLRSQQTHRKTAHMALKQFGFEVPQEIISPYVLEQVTCLPMNDNGGSVGDDVPTGVFHFKSTSGEAVVVKGPVGHALQYMKHGKEETTEHQVLKPFFESPVSSMPDEFLVSTTFILNCVCVCLRVYVFGCVCVLTYVCVAHQTHDSSVIVRNP